MVSDLHRIAVDSCPKVDLIGVYDIDASRAADKAAAWDVRAYSSLGELLADRDVDAVHVLTPTSSHIAVALKCLESGRHVLVEKPVSIDPEEIDHLIQVARTCGRVAIPAHNYAYSPEFQRIVRLVRRGSLGTIRSVWVTYVLKHPEAVASAYGGVLGEVMVHHCYLALAVLGPPSRVHAAIHPPAWQTHPAEDQAWMAWEYPDGASAFLFATFAANDHSADPWTFIVKVIGTDGSASFSWRNAVSTNLETPWFDFGIPIYEDSYMHEATAFRDAVIAGAKPVSSLEDAAMSARLIAAAYDAAGTGRIVFRGEGSGPRW